MKLSKRNNRLPEHHKRRFLLFCICILVSQFIEAITLVEPTDVSIPDTLSTYVGEGEIITPILTPKDAYTSLTWYTSDPNIADVAQAGVVFGKGEGTAEVWCITEEGIQSNICQVTVSYRKPTSVSLSQSSLYLPLGQSSTLTYSLLPGTARADVAWESENDAVATVTPSGVITAHAEGRVKVSIRTDNGCMASCLVTVPPNPSGLSIPGRISLYPGNSRILRYEVTPDNAYHVLAWASSDASVASLKSNGEVTARKPGTATISAVTQNGFKAQCVVEVPSPDYQFYVWTSHDEYVAYGLDEHPVVTCSDNKLHLKTRNYEVEWPQESVQKFTVNDDGVNPVPSQVVIPDALSIAYSETGVIDVRLYPDDYDIEEQFEVRSDNPKVAAVMSKSWANTLIAHANPIRAYLSNRDSVLVKAVGVGEANITMTSSSGKSVVCHVTVPEPIYFFYIYMNDGTENHFALREKPFVGYENDVFKVRTLNETMQYNSSDVRMFTLQEVEANVLGNKPVIPEKDEISREVSAGEVSMSGLAAHELVSVLTSDGMLYRHCHSDNQGRVRISFAQWPKGIYIIKSNQSSFKIILK